ncbi:MFS transporter, SP family, general alpha glucoside:H symporter [Cryptococcus neoformans var. grubii H99]|uniref:MFS transporter, SP family, general alpha glucoside:H symporter n=1 Tax=Cryptococcus neoformans (strain H99 / ATCC 208821 / CBS 10515 / FGSC 9487) TaxID=235443 RepID=J9VSB3_CRYN9|nr:MFS transporter, SP family, general alpha glucoside:H symporter [Cryptococcus neoformans var. grubii H99]AFR94595.1 MFS transporter, SP family, general alpha glucoside:H symporter [Cryptococcus neoformans var. grubii H99]AUB24276.1 MFS transporter, SP family, general alpha glucoside:H symporter [Cryptococcus neoformans var. grubii]OXC85259.1 MFS transporter, SP family, general alpha glucoside:H+ symporter [Cryptococcus neoformans var. grubii AD1-7a]|eukprot:XP_012048861.1 MFS transporter, SP family, general alpha glucoside:H symporter [Cryptococcus neoformans var. grubii H99]
MVGITGIILSSEELKTQDVEQNEKLDSTTNMFTNAAAATDKEHKMTLWQGCKLYPKAILWSVLISSCCAMEGYDISLVGNFYAFEPFNRKYGVQGADGTYQVPARWQTGLSNGAQCGQILGLIVNGLATDRFGYRIVILACLIWLTGVTAIFFCAPNIQTLLAGEILAGIPWGVFQSIAISYAAEVCPVALRGYLTSYGNFCWGWGQLVGIGVIKSQFGRTDQWAYRIPYGLMWMFYPPLIIGIYFAPESPWWLVRKGRIEQAKKSLLRLTSSKTDPTFDATETIDMIRHTTELEQDITSGASYLDCFKGVNLRRTEIVCMLWATQNLAGNTFSNYSTYFFEQAGLTGQIPYDFAMGQYAINMVGTFGAWYLMTKMGRRTLFVGGLCGLCVTLLSIGFVGLVPESKKQAASLATGALMLVWAVFYQCSVGTLAFSLVAEMSTRRLQIKTVALGRAAYNVAAIISNVLTPYMINPTAWNWGNYAGFFWGGSCFLVLIYAYFRVPEPSGRTFAELDILFERKVPARKFKTTEVNAFDVTLHHQAAEDKPNGEISHVERV